ncbi:Fusicoccadiene synthase [Talaromyces islandicus]|uniref:Fusicoccadiene synthase n=1 Tax=Talaromyces islandicus TaxID=28573 RepID=A0A0U1LRS4_TALIS|nr:Fusicoccadiene synthase [Talaromyces islandicus]
MSILDDFPYQHSRTLEQSELPEGYFHILPFRVSGPREGMLEAARAVKSEWAKTVGKEDTPLTADEKDSPLMYVMPECPPDMVAPIVRFGTLVVLWDDETDALGGEQHRAMADDYCLGLISEYKLGKRSPCDFKINNLYLDSVFQLSKQVASDDHTYKRALQAVEHTMRAQPVPPLHEVTFEEYKKHRTVSSAGKLIEHMLHSLHGLKISQEEQDSVSPLIEHGCLALGLVNDLYSFPKEFEEHTQSGNIDVIHNAMAVLMSNYGYTESESKEILKQEILSIERDVLDEYEAWKNSPVYKSPDMRRYMVLAMLAFGGGCYYQARSPRYHGRKLTTSEIDRAQLVGRSHTAWRLPGHAPPKSFTKDGTLLTAEAESLKPEKEEDECTTASEIPDILAPFSKAPAEELCMAPYNYTKSLPGKKTVGRLVECLRVWFQLPSDSITIIEDVVTTLFHATLMIDDIEDGSILRRGKPAAHIVFGMSQTVNSATKVFLDELETLVFGQTFDIYWKFHKTCPKTQEYLTMVDNKTGGFFRMALRLIQVEASAEPCHDLSHLITLMGRYYQIRDDYLNLTSEEYTAKKGFCDDLSEGKFSFPLIHFLQNSSTADIVRGLLFRQENGSSDLTPEVKTYIVSEMRDAGSLTHTRDTLKDLFDAMMEALERAESSLGTNKRLRAFLILLKIE